MVIRFSKPYTPGRRHRSILRFRGLLVPGLSKQPKPTKSLVHGFSRSKGRNNRGIITMRHRGGGHKRLYRHIDFKRSLLNVPGRVKTVEYDPNRNARICLITYSNGSKQYILKPRHLNLGDTISTSLNASLQVGNSLPLQKIPLGNQIHNIEIQPGGGARLVRAAGATAQIVSKFGNYASVRLPSGEIRLLLAKCWATLGQVSNVDANNITLGKAGVSRWLGRRPKVRGSAMNPVDHIHGGGEGRSPIGRKKPMDLWGNGALGHKTRKAKKYSTNYIIRRRKGFQ